MKKLNNLLIIVIVLAASIIASCSIDNKTKTETLNNESSSVVQKTNVPLPQGIDIVRSFFQLIQEKKISEAVMMMNPSITSDDSTKQAWGVQLNAFEKMELKGVEPSMPENWTENKQSYQITAIVKIKAEAVNAPIPNYGWENGENVKWIEVEKINGKWYVNGIASGP